MKTNDLDLGQKVKNLHFLIWNNNSTGGKFFLYMKSGFKVKRRRKKSEKSRGKNFKKKILFSTSTQKVEMPLIKVAYLMLIFLNLKSFPLILFFVVASSLSTLWHLFFSKKRWKIFSCDQTIIYEDITHKNVSGFPALDILWLTYLRGFSQTTLKRFCPILTPYPPPVDICDGILLLK